MSLISLEGLDDQALQDAKTEASSGRKPFPCTPNDYTRHTGRVVKASLKIFESTGKESISMVVANDEFTGEILIDLDPSSAPNPQKALETRNKVIKILEAATGGKLDTVKLEKANGQLVAFSAKHKGFTEKDGRHYHKVGLYFDGVVSSLLPVKQVAMPLLPGQSASAAPAQASASLDDIPF